MIKYFKIIFFCNFNRKILKIVRRDKAIWKLELHSVSKILREMNALFLAFKNSYRLLNCVIIVSHILRPASSKTDWFKRGYPPLFVKRKAQQSPVLFSRIGDGVCPSLDRRQLSLCASLLARNCTHRGARQWRFRNARSAKQWSFMRTLNLP